MKTETALVTEQDTSIDINSLLDAKLSDWGEKFKKSITVDGVRKEADLTITDPKKAAALAESASITKVVSKEMLGEIVPIGGGMFVGVFATELIDGFMAKQSANTRGLAKLAISAGALYAAHKYGNKMPLIGSTGLKVVALLVAFDGVRNLIPIDTYAQKLATKVSKVQTTEGLAQDTTRKTVAAGTSRGGITSNYLGVAGRIG